MKYMEEPVKSIQKELRRDFSDSKFLEKRIITSDLPLQIVVPLANSILNTIFDVKYDIENGFYGLRDKGFVILCRHDSYMDIPLENIFLYKTFGRYPYHIMKVSMPWPLNKLLENFHGYPLIRPKDKKKGKYNNKDISKQTDYLYNYRIPYLLKRKKIAVLHPQGQRDRKKVSIKPGIVKRILQSQKILDEKIPFAALNIIYSWNIFRPAVKLSAKDPAYFDNTDEKGLTDYLLSAYNS